MASLRLRRPGEAPLVLELRPAFSILNQLSMAGVAIPHDCGGKAQCGTCRIKVVSGAESLLPAKPQGAEAVRLAAIGAGPQERLACQIRTVRDLEVEILGRKTQSP